MLYGEDIKVHDKDLYSEVRFPSKTKDFSIVFSQEMRKPSNKDLDLFAKAEAKKGFEFKLKYIGSKIKVENLSLPRTTSVRNFKLIIASILNVNVSDVSLNIETNDVYDSSTVVGNEKIEVFVHSSDKPRNNGYETTFMKDYDEEMKFISKLNQKPPLYPYIWEMEFSIYNEALENVNIAHLFNINETNDFFPKIFVHSDKINSFQGTKNQLKSYVKTRYETIRPFNELETFRNSCVFLYNKTVDSYVRLYEMLVFENGVISFIFKNINQNLSYEEFQRTAKKWVNENYVDFLKKIHLDECVYKLSFTYSGFEVVETSNNSMLEIETKNKILDLSKINELSCFQSGYSTKSSFRSYGFQSNSKASFLKMKRVENSNTEFAPGTLISYYDTTIQLNQQKGSILIAISNSSTFENSLLQYRILTGLLRDAKSEKKELKDLVQRIRNMDNKMKIKILKEIDPVIFGNRFIQGEDGEMDLRDYSQLVQNEDQRPFPITKDEHKILKTKFSDSLLNIENQTTGERLYLFCSSKELPIINYHHMDKQKCVIKCTSRFSNPNQYHFCDESFNGEGNEKTFQNRFVSNTVVAFNPIIDIGRKCQLPEELYNSFPNFLLLKVSKDFVPTDVVLEKFKLDAFVIERNDRKKIYSMLTEFDETKRYILTIKLANSYDLFVLVSSVDGSVFSFDKTTTNAFLKQAMKTSHYKRDISGLITFYNSITKSRFDESLLLNEFMKKTKETTFVVDTDNEFIIGFIWKKTFFSSPKVFNMMEDDTKLPRIYDVMNDVRSGKISLPEIKSLKPEQITKVYKSWKTKNAFAIKYNGQRLLIRSAEVKDSRWKVGFFDRFSFQLELLNLTPINITRSKATSDFLIYNNLLTNYIEICLNEFGEINEEKFSRILKRFSDTKNNFVYLDNAKTIVSWRKSKIKPMKHLELSFENDNLVSVIYEKLKLDMIPIYDERNERMYEGFTY